MTCVTAQRHRRESGQREQRAGAGGRRGWVPPSPATGGESSGPQTQREEGGQVPQTRARVGGACRQGSSNTGPRPRVAGPARGRNPGHEKGPVAPSTVAAGGRADEGGSPALAAGRELPPAPRRSAPSVERPRRLIFCFGRSVAALGCLGNDSPQAPLRTFDELPRNLRRAAETLRRVRVSEHAWPQLSGSSRGAGRQLGPPGAHGADRDGALISSATSTRGAGGGLSKAGVWRAGSHPSDGLAASHHSAL